MAYAPLPAASDSDDQPEQYGPPSAARTRRESVSFRAGCDRVGPREQPGYRDPALWPCALSPGDEARGRWWTATNRGRGGCARSNERQSDRCQCERERWWREHRGCDIARRHSDPARIYSAESRSDAYVQRELRPHYQPAEQHSPYRHHGIDQ